MIVYMYASACLLTTYRRYWSNVSRRSGYAAEGMQSGPVARQQSVSITYSTSLLTRGGQDFDIFNATRPLFTC